MYEYKMAIESVWRIKKNTKWQGLREDVWRFIVVVFVTSTTRILLKSCVVFLKTFVYNISLLVGVATTVIVVVVAFLWRFQFLFMATTFHFSCCLQCLFLLWQLLCCCNFLLSFFPILK